MELEPLVLMEAFGWAIFGIMLIVGSLHSFFHDFNQRAHGAVVRQWIDSGLGVFCVSQISYFADAQPLSINATTPGPCNPVAGDDILLCYPRHDPRDVRVCDHYSCACDSMGIVIGMAVVGGMLAAPLLLIVLYFMVLKPAARTARWLFVRVIGAVGAAAGKQQGVYELVGVLACPPNEPEH